MKSDAEYAKLLQEHVDFQKEHLVMQEKYIKLQEVHIGLLTRVNDFVKSLSTLPDYDPTA